MGLRPAWRLKVDGRDVTDRIRSRLKSIEVTDGRGTRSDQCTITLQDDPPADWPPAGKQLEIALGWEGEVQELGSFRISRPSSSGPPPILRVTGHAVGQGGGGGGEQPPIAAAGTRLWQQGTTIGQMAREMARDMGLEPVVASAADRALTRAVAQEGETHMYTLDRTARELGVEIAVRGGRLVVGPRAPTQSARSGRPLPTIPIAPEQIKRWDGVIGQRDEVARVRARYHDPGADESGTVEAGGGAGPTVTLTDVFESKEAAEEAAAAARSRRRGRARTLTLDLFPGDPRIVYGVTLDLDPAIRPTLAGKWKVTQAVHSLSPSSYSTRVQAEAVR